MTADDPLEAARQRAISSDEEGRPHHIQVVKVKIFTPEIECPDHHPWFPENPRYPWDEDGDIYTIPRETYERWRQIQLDWELMNEEMRQLTGRKTSISANKGLPW